MLQYKCNPLTLCAPPLAGRPTFPAHPESVLRTLSGFVLLFWFVEFLVNRRRHWQCAVSTLQPLDFVLLSTSGDTLLTPTWSPFSRPRTTKRRAALSWFWVSSLLFQGSFPVRRVTFYVFVPSLRGSLLLYYGSFVSGLCPHVGLFFPSHRFFCLHWTASLVSNTMCLTSRCVVFIKCH